MLSSITLSSRCLLHRHATALSESRTERLAREMHHGCADPLRSTHSKATSRGRWLMRATGHGRKTLNDFALCWVSTVLQLAACTDRVYRTKAMLQHLSNGANASPAFRLFTTTLYFTCSAEDIQVYIRTKKFLPATKPLKTPHAHGRAFERDHSTDMCYQKRYDKRSEFSQSAEG